MIKQKGPVGDRKSNVATVDGEDRRMLAELTFAIG